MKKLFGLLLCSVFMLAGCNEAKAEKKEAPAPQPAAAAPAPAPAPAPAASIEDAVRSIERSVSRIQPEGRVDIDITPAMGKSAPDSRFDSTQPFSF